MDRFKNIYTWIGLFGVIGTARGIDVESLTSWQILFENIMNILKNPYLLGCVIMAVIGVLSNTTKVNIDIPISYIFRRKRDGK